MFALLVDGDVDVDGDGDGQWAVDGVSFQRKLAGGASTDTDIILGNNSDKREGRKRGALKLVKLAGLGSCPRLNLP